MKEKAIFWTGILGASLFFVASMVGGFQFENYSHLSQFISETYAIDTPYGKELRYFAFIPSGLLLTVFAFRGMTVFPKSNLLTIGFTGVGIFYGLATVIVSIFPCDKGCNKEFIDPSISQVIHNLTGALTYMVVPFSILAIGLGLQQLKIHSALSRMAFFCGTISIVFVGILFSDSSGNYIGLYQRIIEGTFMLWIVFCSFFIKNSTQADVKG